MFLDNKNIVINTNLEINGNCSSNNVSINNIQNINYNSYPNFSGNLNIIGGFINLGITNIVNNNYKETDPQDPVNLLFNLNCDNSITIPVGVYVMFIYIGYNFDPNETSNYLSYEFSSFSDINFTNVVFSFSNIFINSDSESFDEYIQYTSITNVTQEINSSNVSTNGNFAITFYPYTNDTFVMPNIEKSSNSTNCITLLRIA